MQGWREYFHKMNEMDARRDQEDSDKDENQALGRMEGKPGALKFTAEEYTAWCVPWMNSLIIKVLGASFPTYLIRDRVNRMWRPKDPLKIIPLNNGYYIVSFSNKEDKEYAFQEGPWMIEDHYLIVQRWRPNFNPWRADLQCNIAAWIRLPDIPFEFYNVESLRRIGNMVGKMIKIDRSTSVYDKGGFARICVEIDLTQPLLPTYMVFGEERTIVYEGLHQVCFKCGKYGHQKGECPLCQPIRPEKNNDPQGTSTGTENEEENAGNKEDPVGTKPAAATGGEKVVTGGADEGSPFGKLRMLRRESRGVFNMAGSKQGISGDIKVTVDQDISGKKISSQRIGVKKDVKQAMNENKRETIKDRAPPKTEWIQVGAKRKNVNGGKLKGKDNQPPARERIRRSMPMGHGLEPIKANPFHVLQVREPNENSPDTKAISNVIEGDRPGPSVTHPVEHCNSMEAVNELNPGMSVCNPNNTEDTGPSHDNALMHHQGLDANMVDQDKSEEELETTPNTLLVSQ
ncbi:hypothetical protein K1719_016378 [Acacia pycnantha]|nr:hypothetical protein K1719_016378 [Acacia pycnantha]